MNYEINQFPYPAFYNLTISYFSKKYNCPKEFLSIFSLLTYKQISSYDILKINEPFIIVNYYFRNTIIELLNEIKIHYINININILQNIIILVYHFYIYFYFNKGTSPIEIVNWFNDPVLFNTSDQSIEKLHKTDSTFLFNWNIIGVLLKNYSNLTCFKSIIDLKKGILHNNMIQL